MAVGTRPSAVGQMQTTSAPFVWGKGGRRMTPEEIAREQQIAEALMQPDFSPVQHWTQGLGRVVTGALGGIRDQRATKAAEANTAESNSVLSALLNPQPAGQQFMSPGSEVPVPGGTPAGDPIAAALASQYVNPAVKKLAMEQFEIKNRKPPAPHYWEMNDGSLGMVGPDGKPQVLFKDPTPKINWITADNGDGTKQLIPMGPNGPLTGSGAPQPAPPGVTFTPMEEGGPTPGASGGFRP